MKSIVVEPASNAPDNRDNPEGAAKPPVKDPALAKYEGKSADELIRMHQEAEKALGSKNDELGQWRSLVKELGTARERTEPTNTPKEEPEVKDEDFFKSPMEATRKVIESVIAEQIKPLQQSVQQTVSATEFDRFKDEHPDFETTVQSEGFRAWVNKSPLRQGDATAAGRGNLTAARRLLTDYAEIQALSEGTKPEGEDADKAPTSNKDAVKSGVEAARAAATDTGGRRAAPAPKGARMSQAQVVDTLIKNPDLYHSEAYQRQLREAIRDKRFDH